MNRTTDRELRLIATRCDWPDCSRIGHRFDYGHGDTGRLCPDHRAEYKALA